MGKNSQNICLIAAKKLPCKVSKNTKFLQQILQFWQQIEKS